MGVRKLSTASDLPGHSRSLVLVLFDRTPTGWAKNGATDS